jgi:hypothetical protein
MSKETEPVLLDVPVDNKLHPRGTVPGADKDHGVTTDPHWTDNYEFPATMRIRDKQTKPLREGYADRAWKRAHPDLFTTDTVVRRHARRHAMSEPRKRIVKAH